MHPKDGKVVVEEMGNPRLNVLGLVRLKVTGCFWKRGGCSHPALASPKSPWGGGLPLWWQVASRQRWELRCSSSPRNRVCSFLPALRARAQEEFSRFPVCAKAASLEP